MKKNVSNGMEFLVGFDRILIKDTENPTKYFPTKNENGVIRPGGVSHNVDDDEYKQLFSLVSTGVVLQTGPKCETVKVGDEVMYDIRGAMPIPVKFDADKEALPKILTLSEQNVKCIIRKA